MGQNKPKTRRELLVDTLDMYSAQLIATEIEIEYLKESAPGIFSNNRAAIDNALKVLHVKKENTQKLIEIVYNKYNSEIKK